MTARNLFAENTELTAEMFMSFLNVSFPSLLAAYKIISAEMQRDISILRLNSCLVSNEVFAAT